MWVLIIFITVIIIGILHLYARMASAREEIINYTIRYLKQHFSVQIITLWCCIHRDGTIGNVISQLLRKERDLWSLLENHPDMFYISERYVTLYTDHNAALALQPYYANYILDARKQITTVDLYNQITNYDFPPDSADLVRKHGVLILLAHYCNAFVIVHNSYVYLRTEGTYNAPSSDFVFRAICNELEHHWSKPECRAHPMTIQQLFDKLKLYLKPGVHEHLFQNCDDHLHKFLVRHPSTFAVKESVKQVALWKHLDELQRLYKAAKRSEPIVQRLEALSVRSSSDDDYDPTMIDWKHVQMITSRDECHDVIVKMDPMPYVIGLDFETYDNTHKLALIQISNKRNGHIYILDIVVCPEIMECDALVDLFESKNVTKVVHDGRLEVKVLRDSYRIQLRNIFDTQIAYKMVAPNEDDPNRRISLKDLYEVLGCDQHHPYKDEYKASGNNRKLWEERPLTTRMKMYAAADVWPLASDAIYGQLLNQLIAANKLDAFRIECEQITNKS